MLSNRMFTPHIGVGELRFGMRASEAQAILGPPDFTTGPGRFTGTICEHFKSNCVFVEYDRQGACCSLEFHPGAPLIWEGEDLMMMSYRRLAEFLRVRRITVVERGDGLRCDELGLGTYAPQCGDPEVADPPNESLIVYRKGYYEKPAPAS